MLVVVEYFFFQVEDEKKSFEEKMGQYKQKQKVTIDKIKNIFIPNIST